MITKFGSLFAGFVDLENIGLDGTPISERWLPRDRLAGVFDKVEAMALKMEELGYDTFWGAEHHFQREGHECIPNILMLNVHLAHLTTNLKLGCAFNITPNWHPLRLAEDYATADILTGGRVVFGVGRGSSTREVNSFGWPSTNFDNDTNREVFEEQVEIIMKAFYEESFSYRGKYYTIPPEVPYRGYTLREITLVPRPINLPVETWQPLLSASQRAMDFMAKHGIKAMIDGYGLAKSANDEVMHRWRDTLAAHGREAQLGEDVTMGFAFHIAETEKKAINEARGFFEENMKMLGPLGALRGLSEEQLAAMRDPRLARSAGLPTMEQVVGDEWWFCGPPELVAEKLEAVQEAYPGLEQVNMNCVVGTPQDVILEQLDAFGKHVMPKFKGQAA